MEKSKKTLVVSISNLMSIRNYFHTGIADKLSEKFNLIFLFESELYFQLKKKNLLPNSTNYKIQFVHVSDNYFFNFFYRLLGVVYNAILYRTSTSKKLIVNQMFKNPKRLLIKFISSINIGEYLFPLIKQFFIFFKFQQNYKELIPKSTILVLTIPQSLFDFYIYLMLNKKVQLIVNQIFSWDNVTSRGPVLNSPDYYFVWNKYVKKDIVKYYNFPENKIRLVSVPFYDFIIKNKKVKPFISAFGIREKLTVLYTTGETSFLDYEPALVEEIYYTLNEKYNLNFILRLHPLDNLDNYHSLIHSNIKIVEPTSYLIKLTNKKEYYFTENDYKSYVEQLSSADLILNIASTVTIDALILKKPVGNINFIPKKYNGNRNIKDVYKTEHFSKVVSYHLVPMINKYQDIFVLIDAILNKSFLYNENIYNKFIKDFFSIYKKGSTEKLINSFNNLI